MPINASAGEKVTITITKTGGPNAVLAGIFLGEPADPTAPVAVSDLVATPGDSTVELGWSAPADGGSAILGYHVYRATDGVFTTATQLTTTGSPVTGTAYIDSTAVNGTAYDYWVTAVNSVGESAESNMAEATPAGATVAGATVAGA